MKFRAQEATVKFVPDEIDIVLLDLNLRSHSGWDVFEQLTTQHPLIPIVNITGLPNQYQTALGAGAGALIEKTIEVESLIKIKDELVSEPEEVRFRRICGYQLDTTHLRRPDVGAVRGLFSTD